MRLSALKRVADTTAEGTLAHEHVTYHIYNHPVNTGVNGLLDHQISFRDVMTSGLQLTLQGIL